MRLQMWMFALALVFQYQQTTAIIGGKFATPPQPDAAVIFTQKYGRNARVEGMKNDARGYYTFLGLRYAEPPVGALRFRRAALARLEGEVNATRPCAPCAQPHPDNSGQLLGAEDCLCLNIYSPKMPGSEKGSPVLFWIHGGGFRQGSATYYGGEHLAQKDTILVSVQYRLGSLGFLSTGNKDMPGNVGLLDLSTALQWVLDYIEFFGGDPARVVTIGQGSGGTAASLLALSPMSRSSVSGVAALSGAPLAPTALQTTPEQRAARVAQQTNCPEKPATDLVACLRNLPVEEIVKVDTKIHLDDAEKDSTEDILSNSSGSTGSGAAVEGVDDERALPPLVAMTPTESLNQGDQKVPLLTGVVRDETARAVFGKNSKSLAQKLLSVPNFITNEIINPAKKQLTQLIPEQVQNNIPLNAAKLLDLDTYYRFISKKTSNVTEGLLKIVEATSDAFFNYPAFASVDKWSKRASAYLYRFEYKGNKKKGSHFLGGLPIVGKKIDKDDFIGHGDELAYLFEPLDINGNRLDDESTPTKEDDKVRDIFTDLIVNFAHNVSLVKGGKKSNFNTKTNQFLQIGTDLKITDNFRFCQMALWGNLEQRLQDAACSVIKVLGSQIENIPEVILNSAPKPPNFNPQVVFGGGAKPPNVGTVIKNPFQLDSQPPRSPFGF